MDRVRNLLDNDLDVGEQAGPQQNIELRVFLGRRRQFRVVALLLSAGLLPQLPAPPSRTTASAAGRSTLDRRATAGSTACQLAHFCE